MLIRGQICQLDPARRLATIALEDGRQVTLTFPERASIEVREPTTLGTMGGTLEDLRLGYWVDVELPEHGDGPYACHALHCVS